MGGRQIWTYHRMMNGRDIRTFRKYTLPQGSLISFPRSDYPHSKLNGAIRGVTFSGRNHLGCTPLSLQQRVRCAPLTFQWAVNSCGNCLGKVVKGGFLYILRNTMGFFMHRLLASGGYHAKLQCLVEFGIVIIWARERFR